MSKFIDLFAGIGGFRLAFESLGAKCVFSSEIDKFCGKTYEANFGLIPHGDITQIDANNIPDFDILCAGFPCQPFSLAGKRKGLDDSRSLIHEIYRILVIKRPKAFLLENVQGLLSHNKGATFELIKVNLQYMGYYIHYKVLKACDYGLPTLRPRLYIVGFRNDVNFEWPQTIPLTKNISSILEENVDPKYTISNKLWDWHKKHKQKHNNKFGYILYSPEDKYTGTLTARYGKDGKEILIQDKDHYKNPRKLTPRECARLMGFPDSFVIPVSDTQAYKQFGNSVAVDVVKLIAEQIIKVLK